MLVSKRSPVWIDAQPLLRTWYASALGQSIAIELGQHLDRVLPRIFGYQGLQIGSFSASSVEKNNAGTPADRSGNQSGGSYPIELLEKAGIHRKILLDCPGPEPEQSTLKMGCKEVSVAAKSPLCESQRLATNVTADAISLPIASDVMKLVILPHTLDFCHRPHQALREADRVLTDDGQMVIIGFNPYSLFGAEHLLWSWRERPPWNGHFFSRGRVTEWLSVLNYQVLDSTCLYLRPPINRDHLLKRLSRVEKLQPWLGAVGAVYVLHARKQSVPFTHVRTQRRRAHAGVPVTGFARTSNQNCTVSLFDRSVNKKHE